MVPLSVSRDKAQLETSKSLPAPLLPLQITSDPRELEPPESLGTLVSYDSRGNTMYSVVQEIPGFITSEIINTTKLKFPQIFAMMQVALVAAFQINFSHTAQALDIIDQWQKAVPILLSRAHNEMVQRVAGVKDNLKTTGSRLAACEFDSIMDPMDIDPVSYVPNYLREVKTNIQNNALYLLPLVPQLQLLLPDSYLRNFTSTFLTTLWDSGSVDRYPAFGYPAWQDRGGLGGAR